jgi:hypothetical protein
VVGPKTGLVYFTDATIVYPERYRIFVWDAMYSAKVETLLGLSGKYMILYQIKSLFCVEICGLRTRLLLIKTKLICSLRK